MVNKQKLMVLALSLFVLLQGCGSLLGTPEEKLNKKIDLLMTAKINGAWEKVYDCFDTNFKEKISKKSFLKGKKMTFLSYTIESFQMDTSLKSAEVLVKSDIEANGHSLKGVPENQRWIIEKGEWVLAIKPVTGFID